MSQQNTIKRTICFVIFLLLLSVNAYAGVFGSSNCQECILKEMPGTKNDRAANEILRQCIKKHGRFEKVKKKSPLFGISSASECTIEYSKNTSSSLAAKRIQQACYSLYSK